MNLLPSTTENEYVATELFVRGGQRLALVSPESLGAPASKPRGATESRGDWERR